jgi:hypothetical protein
MRLEDFYLLAIPVALDWVWDKISKRRSAKQNAKLEAKIKAGLLALGDAGERIAKTMDEFQVPEPVKHDVASRLRAATNSLRLTQEPPIAPNEDDTKPGKDRGKL